MIPLQSHWEYQKAKQVFDMMNVAHYLSKPDLLEFYELQQRIESYERNPTQTNIIEHAKGNV